MKELHKIFQQTKHPKNINDYYHILNSSNILNTLHWYEFIKKVSKIDGDIIECGVGRARSIITIAALNHYFSLIDNKYPNRNIYGIDSFMGFPQPSKEDLSKRNPKKGEWSHSPNKQFSYNVRNIKKIISYSLSGNLKKYNIKFIKGFFNNSLDKIESKKIAILHLDADLYESTALPLKKLSSKIVTGGLIVVDDYILKEKNKKGEPWPGARLAVQEFLKKNKNFKIKESIKGSPYLIKLY